MTTESTEIYLRESLQAHVDDVSPTTLDPWLRVSRAHRRSRFRRRTAAVGALAAVAAASGSLTGTPPWADQLRTQPAGPVPTQPAKPFPTQPANPVPAVEPDLGWLRLDDGSPRGALGNDPALRQAVVEALLRAGSGSSNAPQLAEPDTVHLLWGGELEGKRVALARAVQVFDPKRDPQSIEVLLWLTGPAGGGAMKLLSTDTDGPAIKALPYLDADGGRRLLAVVGRDAQAAATRTTISAADGELKRPWSPVPVQDGVVDVPVPDPLGRGPLLLETWVRPGGPGGGFASSVNPFSPSTNSGPRSGLTPAQADTLVEQGRGPGVERGYLAHSAVESAIVQFWSDAAHTSPRVEWSGAVPAERGGGSLVVASAGFPDQGRVLVIQRTSADQGDLWRYVGTVPADAPFGKGSAYSWRLSSSVTSDDAQLPPNKHVVVWMFGSDTESVTVQVNGKTRASTTQDGLGWLLVDKGDQVTVTGNSTDGTRHGSGIELRPQDAVPVASDWPLFGTP
jgi:hypothetical protein